MRHRKIRIIFRCTLKRADGSVVVETEDERQALVKETLRHRIRSRDRVMQVAQLWYELNRLGRTGNLRGGELETDRRAHHAHRSNYFHSHNLLFVKGSIIYQPIE